METSGREAATQSFQSIRFRFFAETLTEGRKERLANHRLGPVNRTDDLVTRGPDAGAVHQRPDSAAPGARPAIALEPVHEQSKADEQAGIDQFPAEPPRVVPKGEGL